MAKINYGRLDVGVLGLILLAHHELLASGDKDDDRLERAVVFISSAAQEAQGEPRKALQTVVTLCKQHLAAHAPADITSYAVLALADDLIHERPIPDLDEAASEGASFV